MSDAPPVSIPEWAMLSWESQERQYPATGSPGITHAIHSEPGFDRFGLPRKLVIESLTMRDDDGKLIGIFYYYPQDCYERTGEKLETAGNANVFVHPDHRRQGVGTQLVTEATQRWDIDFEQQRYSASGSALAHAFTTRKDQHA